MFEIGFPHLSTRETAAAVLPDTMQEIHTGFLPGLPVLLNACGSTGKLPLGDTGLHAAILQGEIRF